MGGSSVCTVCERTAISNARQTSRADDRELWSESEIDDGEPWSVTPTHRDR